MNVVLTIRAAQMRVLAEASMGREIEAMLRRNFPVHCAALGREGTTQMVRQAIGRGRRLDFENAQLTAYVALEFAFGADFGNNPEYPWAQAVLEDRSLPSEPRMQRLRSEALRYLAKLAENGNAVRAESHG